VSLERLRYIGRAVECPLCGGHFRSFAPELWDGARRHGNRARCPRCGSLARHRFLWLHLIGGRLLHGAPAVLHLAPEGAVAKRIRAAAGDYVSADLEPGRADVEADLTALPFDDESFDLIVCSHVLEHVPDDRAAMRELRRVLGPRGTAVVQTPVNYDQAATFEDPSVTDPDERAQRFSQFDHVRVYGPDLLERLEGAGFSVTIVDAESLGAHAVARHGLQPGASALRNDIYVCRRAA
jgi:SAM-dependent methyltransferase